MTDGLAPIGQITDILLKKSKDLICHGTVDEQLVSFRGRCRFRVYMPQKPGKVE